MFEFKATDDSGREIEFKSDSRDVANWERTHHGQTFGLLGADDGRNLSWVALYSISFFAAKRQGLIGSMSEGEYNRAYALDLIENKADGDEDESASADGVDEPGQTFATVAAAEPDAVPA